MEESVETMVDEREELMVSPTGGNPTLRKAHFLKPSPTGTTVPNLLSPPSLSSLPPAFDPQNWPLTVAFNGWRNPGRNWDKWVDLLHDQYQFVWKQAGIYDAIMSSKHEIRRDDDLVLGIAERWCPKTKSFVFAWGEASITLENVMVLRGFSVLGLPVFAPIETMEMKEKEERLIAARKEVVKSEAKKACQKYWARKFMGSGSEIEHEAFLALWLSKFVFPSQLELIRKSIFPIAIHLARGTRIALGPAVLAAIYKDLTVLKETIVALTRFDTGKDDNDVLALTLWSPFQLVQLWVWERFPAIQPNPNLMKEGDTRSARWHRVKSVEVANVRLVLDSAGEIFLWRPYTTVVDNWQFHKFYKEHEGWVSVSPGLEEESLSLARCMRVSQLVELGCLEQYLPHRVAMQFGLDQDLPGCVRRTNETAEIAWSNYSKPFNTKLYIPPQLFESDVSLRYLAWWKHPASGQKDQDATEGVFQQHSRSSKRLKQKLQDSEGEARTNGAHVLADTPKVLKNGHDSLDCRATNDGNHCSEKSQSSATSIANIGDNRMVAGPVKNVAQSETAIGRSNIVMQGANENKPVSLVHNKVSINGNEGKGSGYTLEVPGLQLEARIGKLEKHFAQLKEAKFGCGIKRKLTN